MNESQVKAVLVAYVHDIKGSLASNAALAQLIIDKHAAVLDKKAQKWLKLMANEYSLTDIKLSRLSQYAQLFDYQCKMKTIDIQSLIDWCKLKLIVEYSYQIDIQSNSIPVILSDKHLIKLYLYELMSNTYKHAYSSTQISNGTVGIHNNNVANEPLAIKIEYFDTAESHNILYQDNGNSTSASDCEYMQLPLNTLKDSHANLTSAGMGFQFMQQIADLLDGTLEVKIGTVQATGVTVLLTLPKR